jgi:5'-nucleotidase
MPLRPASPGPPILRAILFDLDDTLFDHRQCARKALNAVHRAHTCFSTVPFDDFEREHAEHLETLHQRVLAGEIDLNHARVERFRRLLSSAGADGSSAADAAAMYRTQYLEARQPVAGAAALLAALRTHARIAVVSNNLLKEQREKLNVCGLDRYIDALVVSEETGSLKPDPEIFRVALGRVHATAAEAVMIGDSWMADIEGAHAAGIAAIWFNRLGLPAPGPARAVPELRGFVPVDAAIETILASFRRASRD